MSVTANAGSDQSKGNNRSVSLNGSGSTAGGGESITAYSWTQTAGTSVSLSGANSATPSFTSPTPSGDNETLTFQLQVTGSLGSNSTDTVDIFVVNVDSSDVIQIANSGISHIIQPQLMSGSSNNPWPWFDTNAISSGLTAGREFPAHPPRINGVGTVSVTNGSANVTGSGTLFTSETYAGVRIWVNTTGSTWAGPFVINTIPSNTSLTLTANWDGSTASGLKYATSRPGCTGTASITNGSPTVTVAGGNLTGEISDDNRLYLKVSGTWTGPFEITSIDSATQLTLASNYSGSTNSSVEWSSGPYFDTGSGTENELYTGFWNYYDQSHTQRINYYRTGNPEFLSISRKIADSWWLYYGSGGNRDFDNLNSPRSVGLVGLILRAIDEGDSSPKWDFIADYVDNHYNAWLGNHISDSELYLGVRDGSYMLLFVAMLSQVLPDTYPDYAGGNNTNGASKRATYKTNLANVVDNYYCRLQVTTAGVKQGAWVWVDDWNANGTTSAADDGYGQLIFHVGLLHRALLYIYECYKNDGTMTSTINNIKSAVIASATNIYTNQWISASISGFSPATNWRCFQYERHSLANPNLNTPTYTGDPNFIREERAINCTLHEVFGYAYLFSGDVTHKTHGDDVFSSSFGNGQGPGADTMYNLSDYITPGGNRRVKEYDESYQASGTYLVNRLSVSSAVTVSNVRLFIQVL